MPLRQFGAGLWPRWEQSSEAGSGDTLVRLEPPRASLGPKPSRTGGVEMGTPSIPAPRTGLGDGLPAAGLGTAKGSLLQACAWPTL